MNEVIAGDHTQEAQHLNCSEPAGLRLPDCITHFFQSVTESATVHMSEGGKVLPSPFEHPFVAIGLHGVKSLLPFTSQS